MSQDLILKMKDEHAKAIMRACDLMARLYMGQTDVLNQISSSEGAKGIMDYDFVKKVSHPELQANSSYSILSPQISNEARVLIEIHDVIRHFLSWEKEENGPEERNWSKQFGVNYDTPHCHSGVSLPKIEREQNEKGGE